MQKTILFFLLFFPFYLQAQCIDDGEGNCGLKERLPNWNTLKFETNADNIFNYLKKQAYFSTDSLHFIKYRVPVKLWIYTKNDGSGNVSKEEIRKFITDLNYYNITNKTGFRYYLQDFCYIKKNRHNKMGYYMEAPWQSLIHKSKGAINVHIAGTIKKGHTTVRGTFNKATKSVLTKQHTSHTSLAHEIGHYFGLYHPHRDYDRNKCHQEAVSRTRVFKGCLFKHGKICETSGDKLCDTPAEPRLSKAVNRECKYTGDFVDNWGEKYKPDVNNIMSYPAYRRCRNKFTPGQIAVMLYSAENNKYAKYWATSKNGQAANIQYAFDDYEPDFDREAAAQIKENTVQYHTFHSIFTGSSKNNLRDTVDWLQLVVYSYMKNNVILTFDNGNSVFPKMEVLVIDSNGKTITKRNIEQGNKKEIKLKKLPVGKYYIRIKAMGKYSFADYTVAYRN